jgi:hypothetical protein
MQLERQAESGKVCHHRISETQKSVPSAGVLRSERPVESGFANTRALSSIYLSCETSSQSRACCYRLATLFSSSHQLFVCGRASDQCDITSTKCRSKNGWILSGGITAMTPIPMLFHEMIKPHPPRQNAVVGMAGSFMRHLCVIAIPKLCLSCCACR